MCARARDARVRATECHLAFQDRRRTVQGCIQAMTALGKVTGVGPGPGNLNNGSGVWDVGVQGFGRRLRLTCCRSPGGLGGDRKEVDVLVDSDITRKGGGGGERVCVAPCACACACERCRCTFVS